MKILIDVSIISAINLKQQSDIRLKHFYHEKISQLLSIKKKFSFTSNDCILLKKINAFMQHARVKIHEHHKSLKLIWWKSPLHAFMVVYIFKMSYIIVVELTSNERKLYGGLRHFLLRHLFAFTWHDLMQENDRLFHGILHILWNYFFVANFHFYCKCVKIQKYKNREIFSRLISHCSCY